METLLSHPAQHPIVENFLTVAADFFKYRRIGAHIHFLDKLMEQTANNRPHFDHDPQASLLYLEKIAHILDASHSLAIENPPLRFGAFCQGGIPEERQPWLGSLKTKERQHPLKIIRGIFKMHHASFFKRELQKWLFRLPSATNMKAPQFSTYRHIKRLIEACWLIYNDYDLQQQGQLFQYSPANIHFALSCPLLLRGEQLDDPYLYLEEFFSFNTITGYKRALKNWFRAVIDQDIAYNNADELYFLFGRFTQFLQACYIIASHRLNYLPQLPYNESVPSFGHWILATTFPGQEPPYRLNYIIQNLPEDYRQAPLRFFIEQLSDSSVALFRTRFDGWFEAALSNKKNLHDLDQDAAFQQYDLLLQLLEAAFLILTKPAIQ